MDSGIVRKRSKKIHVNKVEVLVIYRMSLLLVDGMGRHVAQMLAAAAIP